MLFRSASLKQYPRASIIEYLEVDILMLFHECKIVASDDKLGVFEVPESPLKVPSS